MARSLPRSTVWQTLGVRPNVELPRNDAAGPASDVLDDATLVRRVQERDERAIEELVQRYDRPLFSFAYRVLRDDRLAQDVVQDVFLTIWRDAGRYDPACGAVSSWLLTMTRYKAIDSSAGRPGCAAGLWRPTCRSSRPVWTSTRKPGCEPGATE